MDVTTIVSCFFAGAFATNAIPHYVAGLQGKPMQSPFAKPPGKGLSTSRTNVLWGFFNIVIAYLLMTRAVSFDPHSTLQVTAFGAGSLIIALFTANHFGEFNGGSLKKDKVAD